MGETVTKGDDEDPKKKTWTRIAALPTDPRTEERQDTTFKNLRIHDFLASLHLLPKWRLKKDDEQEGSLFWKYMCVLIKQLDPTPRNNRSREDAVDPSDRCVQIRLGEKITTGINKGTSRAVQGRCTSCRARNKRFEKKGPLPNTAWGCVCHPGLYFCKN